MPSTTSGQPRGGLLRVHEDYVEAYVESKRAAAMGAGPRCSGFEDEITMDMSGLPSVPAVHWDKRTQLAHERDMLGLYVDHPLFGIEHVLHRNSDTGSRRCSRRIRAYDDAHRSPSRA